MILTGSTGPAVPNTAGLMLNDRMTTLTFHDDDTVTVSLSECPLFGTAQTVARLERVTFADTVALEEAHDWPVIRQKPGWIP